MNAIDYIAKQIMNEIPKELLTRGFTSGMNSQYSVNNLVSMIKDKIIYDQYLTDLNVTHGTDVFLYINDGLTTYSDASSVSYFYEQDVLNGLDIVSAHGLYNHVRNDLIGGFGKMRYNSILLPNTNVSIVAPNTVLVSATGFFRQKLFDTALHVTVSNNHELSNIGPRWYPTLAEGAILLTKRFLYNELAIQQNMGSLYGGGELGMFNEILSSYSDASEMYREFVHVKLAKSLVMNDKNSYTSHIRSQLSPSLQAKFNK